MKYVIVVGCGRVGSQLARILAEEGHNVVVIDKEQKSFDRLGRTFNGITLTGNGFDRQLLKAAGIEKADALCAVTNGDNTNLVTAQVAKKVFNVPKVITRVYDPSRAAIYRDLGLDIISGTVLVASMIRDKIIESKLSSFLIESKELGILEIPVDQDMRGQTVEAINMPAELIVVAVRKKKVIIIPQLDTKAETGDVLVTVVKTQSLSKIRKAFKL